MAEQGALKVTEHPASWKDNFVMAVAALIEIGKALHRIADALEERRG